MAKIFGKHWRLVSLVLGIIILFWILYTLRIVIFPFVLGLVLAYLLLPLISWLERNLPRRGKWLGFKRASSILIIFILLTGLIGVFSYFIVTAVIDAAVVLLESAPTFIGQSLAQVQKWLEVVREQLPPEIRYEVDKALLEAGVGFGNLIRDAFIRGISFVPRNFSVVLGFAALPFFLFYIMKDSEKLRKSFYSALTPGLAEHAKNIILIVERVLGQYIRAQLMLGLIVAYFSFIGLWIISTQLAPKLSSFVPALAILAGITELIPTLGPWIGGAVAVVVTLAIAPEKVIWIVVLYLGIQLVENYFFVPRIQSAYLHIHPAVMIVLLVLGAYVAGFWGLLLVGPLTATVVEIYKYIHQCYQIEKAGAPPE